MRIFDIKLGKGMGIKKLPKDYEKIAEKSLDPSFKYAKRITGTDRGDAFVKARDHYRNGFYAGWKAAN